MKTKKLIVFGGSFDPVHQGHIKVALKAFKKINANKLFFIPCNKNHPGNKKISASNKERIDMLNLAIKNYPFFEICDYETKLDSKTPSYTINTIRYLKENYGEYELYLLIGYDQLVNFKTWKDYQEILDYVKIICHVRKINNSDLKNVDFPYQKIGFFNIDASSKELKFKPNKKMLDENVLKYINENAIYARERIEKVMSSYRYEHSLEVAKIAKELAIRFKLYPLVKKAYVAGIYHDYAKDFNKDEVIAIAEKKLNLYSYPSWKVLHADVGAYLIEKEFMIDDYQILTAIKNHTIPKDYSTLTKLLYVADKIAPRENVEDKREYEQWVRLSKQNLDQCFRTILEFYKSYNYKG